MKRATWRCKVCREWGHGGPATWLQHFTTAHAERSTAVGSSIQAGFVSTRLSPGWFDANPARVIWCSTEERGA